MLIWVLKFLKCVKNLLKGSGLLATRVWICSSMIYQAAKLCQDLLFVSGKLLVDFGYQPSDEIYRSIVFTFLSNVFSTIIGLPFSIYSTFVLEEKHGFNQQTAVFYIKDQIKKFLLSQVISLFSLMINQTVLHKLVTHNFWQEIIVIIKIESHSC